MREYAELQLMSNLPDISVTVFGLSSWARALSRSKLTDVCHVVGQPQRSSLMTPLLPLWSLPHLGWHTLLTRNIVFACCTKIHLWFSDSLPPSPQKSNDNTLLNKGAIRNCSQHVWSTTARNSLNRGLCCSFVLSARARSKEIPGTYTHIDPRIWIPFV